MMIQCKFIYRIPLDVDKYRGRWSFRIINNIDQVVDIIQTVVVVDNEGEDCE